MTADMGGDYWQPSCTRQMLLIRSEMHKAVRKLFEDCGYLEVETPCLSRDVVLDAWVEPFEMNYRGGRWFLQTSPEAHMKRLLAADSGSIFQFSRVFRRNEEGDRHNPEFTMLEWYGVDTNWQQQLEMTERIVRAAAAAAARVTGKNIADKWSSAEFGLTTYAAAFQERFGVNVLEATAQQLLDVARKAEIELPETMETCCIDDILNVLLAVAIEPSLGSKVVNGLLRPEFLCDYPSSQAALAVVTETPPAVARRFELYIRGIELCNGYEELTDADELRRREAMEIARRGDASSKVLPGAGRLAGAMRSGLPRCSGVALGFDRLVMVATESSDIRQVMPFPGDLA